MSRKTEQTGKVLVVVQFIATMAVSNMETSRLSNKSLMVVAKEVIVKLRLETSGEITVHSNKRIKVADLQVDGPVVTT